MSIETTSAQNTSKPASTESKHAKAKSGDTHGQGASSTGGFMAILASMDTAEIVASVTTETPLTCLDPAATALAAMQRAAAALKGVAGEAESLVTTGPGDVAAITDSEANLAKFLQSEEVVIEVAALPPPIDVPWQPDLPADTAALLAQAAQWSAAGVPSAEQSNPKTAVPVAVTNPSNAGRPVLGGEKPEGTALANRALGEKVSELAVKVGRAQKEVSERLAAVQMASAEPAVAGGTAVALAESRQAQVLQKMVDVPQNLTASALTAALTNAPGRREEVVRERSIFRPTAPDAASPVQTYAPSATAGSFANPPAPVTSMETYVAEKVAYWISNDVQNAEMKLDGIGELPVEVSIRMQGNEAHIAFRSDELQARAALENASEHLKDMLQREGLVLTGVSVGTAGAGDAGGQERKSRQGARQAGVVSVEPARTESAAGSRRATGGALDLFV